jgi:hypothetical protein
MSGSGKCFKDWWLRGVRKLGLDLHVYSAVKPERVDKTLRKYASVAVGVAG